MPKIVERRSSRSSGIELLRIIAMVMIVAYHLSTHVSWQNLSGANKYYITALSYLGRIGVAIFFMITGYFLARQKKFDWKKIFVVIRPTWFYSWLFLGLAFIFKDEKAVLTFPMSPYLLRSIFPILSNSYWFISSYVVMMLLSPYIKKWLDTLKEKELSRVLMILFVSSFAARMINLILGDSPTAILEMPIGFFYIVLGYTMRFYEKRFTFKQGLFGILLSAGFILLAPLVEWLFRRVGYNMPPSFFSDIYSPLTLIAAISLFLVFSKATIKSKVINYFSSHTFGVYLIHENIFLAPIIWNTNRIFSISERAGSGTLSFIAYTIFVVATVYFCSTALEILRKLSARLIIFIANKRKTRTATAKR